VRAHLPPRLLDKAVPLLASRELRRWRDSLVGQLSAATVNRTATGLKAALNLAAEHDERIAIGAHGKPGLPRSRTPSGPATSSYPRQLSGKSLAQRSTKR